MGDQTSEANQQAGRMFMEWLQQDKPNQVMFWLSGKPASGKSTLMKYIHTQERGRLEELLCLWTQSVKPLILGFYFSAESENNLGRSREGLLRAILHQILSECTEMRHKVLGKKLAMQDWTLGSYTNPSSVTWTWKELQEMFRTAISETCARHMYIFADGLDEYRSVDSYGNLIKSENGEDDDMVRFNGHTEVAELFLDLTKNPRLKICVASRPLSRFEDLFQDITNQNLRFNMEDLTRADISKLVTERLSSRVTRDRLDALEIGLRENLIQETIAKSYGVFTWVDLVTRRLIKCITDGDSAQELREYLNHVPFELKGPKGLYMKLLREIHIRHRRDAARILKVMKTSRHPLTAVALSYCEMEPDDVLKSPIKKRTQEQLEAEASRMERRIRSRCAGILEMGINPSHKPLQGHIGKEPVVRFIHLTVLEFLRESTAWEFLLDGDSMADIDVSVYLLGSCLLRLKRIGVTEDFQDVWGAVHDAIYYAGRAEKATRMPQISLLDDLDATMSWLTKHHWPDEIDDELCKGHWHSFNKISGTFPGRAKEYFRDGYHWVSLEPQEQGGKKYSKHDNFLTYAIWGNLELYLRTKITKIKERILKERDSDLLTVEGNTRGDFLGTRPLLALATAPSDPPPLMAYNHIHGDRLGIDQSNSTIVRILLESGCSPGETYGKRTIWENMMSWSPRLQAIRPESETFCSHDSNFMKVMKVMIEYGANPNIIVSHGCRIMQGRDPICSLLFVATTCADISMDKRKKLISLLRNKGSELFPGEAATLCEIAPWADIETWPVLDTELFTALCNRWWSQKPAVPIKELREGLGQECFFTPPVSPWFYVVR